MPFGLPWFDGGVDPLLPNTNSIKPPIYLVDSYQTHDFLWFSTFNSFWSNFTSLTKSYFPVPSFGNIATLATSPDFFGGMFFDRFTPWDYSWAENYSTQVFNFVVKYSFFLGF